MLPLLEKNYRPFFVLTSIVMALLVLLRAWLIPFAHDEVATFYFYVQPGSFIPFYSHVDANGHFLTNVGTWLCYKLFGSSPLALRLPNVLAFVLLCLASYRLSRLLNGIFAKLLLLFGLVVAFHFAAFFSLCRGYGLSMAFLLWAMSFFYAAVEQGDIKKLGWFVFTSQLALAANLTLVFVLLICSGIILVWRLLVDKRMSAGVVLLWLLHFALLAFWIAYAFYLQHNGALYYGSGDSYWHVSFVSLIDTVFFHHPLMHGLVALVFSLLLVYWCYAFYQRGLRFITHSRFALTFFVLLVLVFSFFALKQLFHVNYPEDRTGLFFYVFFVLSLAFKVSELRYVYQPVSIIFSVFVLLHLVFYVNLHHHPWRIYETFPQRFVNTLCAAQKQSTQKITIGGHRLREFIYGFMNYNSGGMLNHMTSPEAMQMNADYAVAYKADAPYYHRYYDEIDSDATWGFVLLKHRAGITRTLLYEDKSRVSFNGQAAYNNAYECRDTTFPSRNPLLAEFELQVYQVPVPFNAWLVLQIDADDADGGNALVRVPLNLLRKNLHQSEPLRLDVLSGNLPKKIKRLVCYLWNIDQKPVEIQLVNFKLYQLNSEGIQVVSKANI